jgi:succinate dehydrogenase hydrophobic anchor subunit
MSVLSRSLWVLVRVVGVVLILLAAFVVYVVLIVTNH